MADEAGEDDGGKAKPKSRKKLFMIAGGALALALLGGGAYFALKGGGDHGGEEKHAEKAEGHGEKHGDEKGAGAAASYVDLPEMTVNLATAEPDKMRYVRLNVALEVDKPEMAAAIKPMLPRVLDSVQTHLRELRPDDLRGSSGAYRLKEELLRRVNLAVAPAKVDAVLFKDIVVQ